MIIISESVWVWILGLWFWLKVFSIQQEHSTGTMHYNISSESLILTLSTDTVLLNTVLRLRNGICDIYGWNSFYFNLLVSLKQNNRQQGADSHPWPGWVVSALWSSHRQSCITPVHQYLIRENHRLSQVFMCWSPSDLYF